MEIQVELTNRCALRCKHCSNNAPSVSAYRDISFDQLYAFAEIAPKGCKLWLTGGEPTLTCLKTITSSLLKLNADLQIGIFTSGIIKDKILRPISQYESDALFSSGLRDSFFSIYHLDKTKHDAIVDYDGSFECTLRTIKNFKKSGINVRVHIVLNKYNVNELHDIINFLCNLGIENIRLLRLVKTGCAIDNWDDIGVSYDIQNNAIEKIYRARQKFKTNVEISGFPLLTPCRPGNDAVACQAGIRLLYITLDGDVYPCACTRNKEHFKIGHISELHIFNNLFTNNRKSYRPHCLNPVI